MTLRVTRAATRAMLAPLIALSFAACSTLAPAPQQTTGWMGVWGASPSATPAGGRSFENQTIRQVVRVSEGGSVFRIRFTNEFGDKPLEIGGATIAPAKPDGALTAEPMRITFAGSSGATVPPGAPLLSDPIRINVAALDSLSISMFLPGSTGPCTCHFAGTATTWISAPGNFTGAVFTPTSTTTTRAFISAVEVEANAPATLVAFGDSITDGTASTVNTNRRWPDVLAERLAGANAPLAISNQAIAGNRVIGVGIAIFGVSALTRFDRDVLSVPNAKWLVVLEGINDIGSGGQTPPSADEIIAGYRQIIARSHAQGIKAYFGTLLAYEGARYYTEKGEAVRQQVNTWIRTSGEPDAVIDFDAATRDPANPKRMQAGLQSGDWLHPNDAGYKVMGEAVDLALFN